MGTVKPQSLARIVGISPSVDARAVMSHAIDRDALGFYPAVKEAQFAFFYAAANNSSKIASTRAPS
jgi:hypothetical protein